MLSSQTFFIARAGKGVENKCIADLACICQMNML